MKSRRLQRKGCMLGAAVALSIGVGSCQRTGKKPGELVVTIDTDMAMPEQIDLLHVRVTVGGQPLHEADYDVGKPDDLGNTAMPGTLVIVAGSNPSTPVTINVSGRNKQGVWRTFRQAVTTVPQDRSVTLRMPVQWLCDGSAVQPGSSDLPPTKSTCGNGNTCQSGQCVPNKVESKDLEEYQPETIYGGGSEPSTGSCFDTLPCMIAGAVADPDDDCTIEASEMRNLNIALRVAGDGICDSTQTTCFVPLDGPRQGTTSEGWQPAPSGNRIALPRAACDKMHKGIVSGIYVSNTCATKTAANPPCGRWSNVTAKAPPKVPITDAAVIPTAALVAKLESDAGAAYPCCPLLSDGKQLYTCICATKADASLVVIDPVSGRHHAITHLAPPPDRRGLAFSAALFDGELYWPDNDRIQRTPLATAADGGATPLLVDGAIYSDTSLFVDDGAVYALASGVTGAKGAPVQLLRIPRDAPFQSFDTGSETDARQFGADQSAIYFPVATPEGSDGGTARAWRSRVIRIAKTDGATSTVFPERMVPDVKDANHRDTPLGGYIGVQADGTSVFALYEDAAVDAGAATVQLFKSTTAGDTAATMRYEDPLDPAVSSLGMLGVVDGAVVLSRVESDAKGTATRSSYVLVVPKAGGKPSIVKDFVGEFPLAGLAVDAQRIYWLNSSGSVYGLPRSALE